MSIVEFIRSIWEANHVVAGRIVRNGHAEIVDLFFVVWILFDRLFVYFIMEHNLQFHRAL